MTEPLSVDEIIIHEQELRSEFDHDDDVILILDRCLIWPMRIVIGCGIGLLLANLILWGVRH